MSINFTDFSKTPMVDSPFKGLMESALKGYQMGRAPAQMAEAEKQQRLQNSLKQLEAEHAPKKYEQGEEHNRLANAIQEAALKNMPAKQRQEAELNAARIAKLKTPALSGNQALKPNGPVANAEYIHNLEHTPGVDPEHIKALKEAFKIGQEHTEATTGHTKKQTETQESRAPMSPVTRVNYEINEISKGVRPYTGEKLTPIQQNEERNTLLLDRTKKITDPKMRNQLLNASNMNITLNSINPVALTQYSGGEGKVNKIADSILSSAGVDSPEWDAYVTEANKASAAAKQMRLYLGSSIQPNETAKLEKLTAPESWNISPKQAAKNFEFMRDLMKRETDNLLRAATDPSLYKTTEQQQTGTTKKLVYNPATGRLE